MKYEICKINSSMVRPEKELSKWNLLQTAVQYRDNLVINQPLRQICMYSYMLHVYSTLLILRQQIGPKIDFFF